VVPESPSTRHSTCAWWSVPQWWA